MTEHEALRIAYVLTLADRGSSPWDCENCVSDLVEKMQQEFPEFNWVSLAEWFRVAS